MAEENLEEKIDEEESFEEKLKEIVSELKPEEMIVGEKPAEIVAEEKTTEVLVEKKPAEVVVEEKPAEIVIEEKPAEVVAEEKPAEVVAEEKPAEVVAEEKSEEIVAEEKPEEIVAEAELEEEIAEAELKKVPEEVPEQILLKWNENIGEFDPIASDSEMNEGIFIELNKDKKEWKYFYIEGASLIARRTALRSANGISKTGYLHPDTNIRYGVEYKLVEEKSPYEDMPDSLKKAQRAWYMKERKKK